MSHLAFYFYNSGTIPVKEGEEECKVRKTKNKVCVFFCRKSLQFSGKNYNYLGVSVRCVGGGDVFITDRTWRIRAEYQELDTIDQPFCFFVL